ncbi:MAG: hypothetical protein HYZ52_03635 [Candidatus Omnitrophica bacterium]|nr:hypothetical protein [Candidatus Omnitrophota bacterium]
MLFQFYSFRLLDGLTSRDLKVLGDPSSGILYEDNGSARSELQLADFFRILPKAYDLFNVLKTNSAHAKQFQHIFGGDQVSSTTQSPTAVVRKLLFDVTGTPDDPDTRRVNEAYDQRKFLVALQKADQLLTALQRNAKRLGTFNRLFLTNLPKDGSASDSLTAKDDIKFLFDTVGSPRYNLSGYLRILDLNYRRGDENFRR